jgi:xanthine dehydrogenase small subunit
MIEFVLNGRRVQVGHPALHTTLLDFVRTHGLTGAKEGCAEGECGACAVAVLESSGGRSIYRAVNSCLVLLPMAAGREVYTVEALAGKELSDPQRAMAEAGGSQCGYCTPGFVVSLFAAQHLPGHDGGCDTAALTGNLCRCTGYRPIRDAAATLGPAPKSALRDRLESPVPVLKQIELPNFVRPLTLEDCVSILTDDPEARVVAGATDLAVESNLAYRRWRRLVSLDAVAELREFSNGPDRVRIGAALPLSEVAALWTDAPHAIEEWQELFASPLIRNRATLGGNLATASPIGDSAPLLLALDALVEIAGQSGRRRLPLAQFFTAYRQTSLARGEIIAAIEIPKPLSDSLRFYKVAKRRFDDISTVAAAFSVDIGAGGRVERARFAFGGVAATPLRVTAAEEAVSGRLWDLAAVERVQSALDRTLQPMSDHRGSREYRLEVSKSLVEKFYWETRQ